MSDSVYKAAILALANQGNEFAKNTLQIACTHEEEQRRIDSIRASNPNLVKAIAELISFVPAIDIQSRTRYIDLLKRIQEAM